MIEQDGESFLLLRDPSGYVADPVAVSPVAGLILGYLDGRSSIAEIVPRLRSESGIQATEEALAHLVGQLDEIGFLDSPRFEAIRFAANKRYRAQPARPVAFAGVSYPADPAELRERLDATFAGVKASPADAPPFGIVAPHIDLRVAGPSYAHAYAGLRDARVRPDLVVVLGTSHGWISEPFVASALPYDTPLGLVPCDGEFLRGVESLYSRDLYADEAVHAREHSIEFQVVHLRYLFGDAVPPIVPVICQSLEVYVEKGADPARAPEVKGFVRALLDTARAQEKRMCVVAGADLAHLGPRFDDPDAIGADGLADLEGVDRKTLAELEAGNARGFYDAVTADGNRRRICGLSPIYITMLACAGRRAILRDYRQWLEGGSVVSFAAAEIPSAAG